jgi:hypothetical protein
MWARGHELALIVHRAARHWAAVVHGSNLSADVPTPITVSAELPFATATLPAASRASETAQQPKCPGHVHLLLRRTIHHHT